MRRLTRGSAGPGEWSRIDEVLQVNLGWGRGSLRDTVSTCFSGEEELLVRQMKADPSESLPKADQPESHPLTKRESRA